MNKNIIILPYWLIIFIFEIFWVSKLTYFVYRSILIWVTETDVPRYFPSHDRYCNFEPWWEKQNQKGFWKDRTIASEGKLSNDRTPPKPLYKKQNKQLRERFYWNDVPTSNIIPKPHIAPIP